MLRLFPEHVVRPAKSLDGRWDFVTATDIAEKQKIPSIFNRTIQVPSVWESLPELENYRGKGWFKRKIHLKEKSNVRLVFGGASHSAVVYIDGRKYASHYDAFTPWDVIAPKLPAGEHTIIVEVDNSFGKHSALHVPNDYYTYGGITRPVELQLIDDVFIDKMFLTPKKDRNKWQLDIELTIRNISRKTIQRQALATMNDNSIDFGNITLPSKSEVTISGTLKNLEISQWSAAAPQLYYVSAKLHDDQLITDDKIDRIGFREVKVSGHKVMLNGKQLKLGGVNRHEDHPHFGCAIPPEAMAYDLELIRDMGCNFIRTSHYPNDMRFLDMCDEMGFYVWEEAHARDIDFKHPKFIEQALLNTEEMVTCHYNRPSIIIWGCLNECESHTPGGKKIHAKIISKIKNLDSSRPVSFASNKAMDDISLGLADIVSWNAYIGWYPWDKYDGADGVEHHIKEMLQWLNSPKSRGAKGKPVIMSEFGAGAIYGNRQKDRAKWSEEGQYDILNEQLRVYLAHPKITGAAIWQFCDIRVTPEWRWQLRPNGLNNKGIFDEYRRPKLCHEIVKKRMMDAKL